MRWRRWRKGIAGFTLLEVTLSLTILGVTCPLILAGLTAGSLKIKKCSFDREATFLIEKVVSQLSELSKEENFNGFEEPIGFIFSEDSGILPEVISQPEQAVQGRKSQTIVVITVQEESLLDSLHGLSHLKFNVQRPVFLSKKQRQHSRAFYRSIRL